MLVDCPAHSNCGDVPAQPLHDTFTCLDQHEAFQAAGFKDTRVKDSRP